MLLLYNGVWLKVVDNIDPPAVFNTLRELSYEAVVQYEDLVLVLWLDTVGKDTISGQLLV